VGAETALSRSPAVVEDPLADSIDQDYMPDRKSRRPRERSGATS